MITKDLRSHLEITKLMLVHCNIANNNDQHNSELLYAFVPNKLFGQLLKVPPPNLYF